MLDSIAKIICNIATNDVVQGEVLMGIDDNLYFGLDEELRLVDILFPYESKIIRDKQSISTITELFRKAFSVKHSLVIEESLNPIVEYVLKNDITIYLPYSKHQKIGLPIIAYGTEETDEEKVPIYSKLDNNEKLSYLNLTEEFMQKYNIWIVKPNDIPYNKLPYFIHGKYVNIDGIVFATRNSQSLSDDVIDDAVSINNPNFTYTVRLWNVTCERQYDARIAGGSELYFRLATAVPDSTVTETNVSATNSQLLFFTRDEINNKTEKQGSWNLVMDWRPEEFAGGFFIWEDDYDWGTSSTIPLDVSVASKFTLKMTLPVGGKDDQICSLNMSRQSYFDNAKYEQGNGFQYDANNIGWAVWRGGDIFFSLRFNSIPHSN
jgi:hypothetical protein